MSPCAFCKHPTNVAAVMTRATSVPRWLYVCRRCEKSIQKTFGRSA